MIVIIPLGGTGERFKNNYKEPKALIKVFWTTNSFLFIR